MREASLTLPSECSPSFRDNPSNDLLCSSCLLVLILATDPSLKVFYSVPWSMASILNETGFRAPVNYATQTDLARTHTAHAFALYQHGEWKGVD